MKQGKILIIDDNEDVLFALNLLVEPYVEQIRVTTQPRAGGAFHGELCTGCDSSRYEFRRDAISGRKAFLA